jgi:hypothetical protein
MPDNESSAPSSADQPRSPFAGCLILILAVGMLAFLIGFSTLVLFRQYAEIERFTEEAPVPRAIPAIEDAESELVALAERIERFRQQLASDDEPVTLALNAREMNLAIAAYAPLAELRGTFEVLEIGPELMDVGISFPLNGKPRLTREGEDGWFTSDSRHLNAIMRVRPVLMQREIFLQIEEIHPHSGASVPEEFIGLMSPYRITERYLDDPVLGPAMAALTRVGLDDGRLVLAKNPGETPAGQISDTEVDSGARRFFLFFGIAATLFLIFAAAVIIIGLRTSKKRAMNT